MPRLLIGRLLTMDDHKVTDRLEWLCSDFEIHALIIHKVRARLSPWALACRISRSQRLTTTSRDFKAKHVKEKRMYEVKHVTLACRRQESLRTLK